jgi:hypothetical protein
MLFFKRRGPALDQVEGYMAGIKARRDASRECVADNPASLQAIFSGLNEGDMWPSDRQPKNENPEVSR